MLRALRAPRRAGSLIAMPWPFARACTAHRRVLATVLPLLIAGLLAGCGGGSASGGSGASGGQSAEAIERSEEDEQKKQEAAELVKDREMLSSGEGTPKRTPSAKKPSPRPGPSGA